VSVPFEIDLPVIPFVAGCGSPRKDFPFLAAVVYSVIEIGGSLGHAGAWPRRTF
jgi:hypothetical protein